jgi:hypothetical protein
MNPELEKLVQMSLVDGQVTDKEREIILRKAVKLGLDVDEVEMYLEGFISSNRSNTNSGKNQEISENQEIRTAENDVNPTRKFTPKTFKRIEPAMLDKERKFSKLFEMPSERATKKLHNNVKLFLCNSFINK